MTVPVLQFILDIIDSVVSFDFLFMPIIVMSVFALVGRLYHRRYS